MTVVDILDKIMTGFPPVMVALLFASAFILFMVGFGKRGLNFIKYGFGQTGLDSSLEKRFDELSEKMASKDDIARLDSCFNELSEKMATKDDIRRLDSCFNELSGKVASLSEKMATKDDITRLDSKIETIETNHFGHLKSYLGILNGVLLDKIIIDNETRARLDNELRGM
jgi:predicted nuclease with TOPRIM domain